MHGSHDFDIDIAKLFQLYCDVYFGILPRSHSVLECLLNANNSSRYVFPPMKPRGNGVHIQSNRRSKDFEDIAIFVR